MALEVGIEAPNFVAETEAKDTISLNNYLGEWVVLYFYPRNNTSCCIKEACSFRDNMEEITSLGAVVLGVSPDTVASDTKFKNKHSLNFELVADPERVICEMYGTMADKTVKGELQRKLVRSTFIINPEGKIAHIFNKVKVAGHTEQVIEKLKELKAA